MPRKEKKPKLSIVIPVFNEGTNLKTLLRILSPMVDCSHEIRVVHDIPNDNSIPVVKKNSKKTKNLFLVHNKLGRGVINAIKSGVKSSKGEYVLIIAADDIGPLLSINDMVELMEEGCDLVNATRYAHGGKNIGGGFLSTILSTTANKIFYKLSGSSLTDPTFGVKIFKREKFDEIKLESKPVGWAVSFEFAIKAQEAGWKLGEVPLMSLNRLYGHGISSFKLNWIKEYLKWFFYGMKKLSRTRNSKILVRIPDKLKRNN